jgi:hypothetical protein
MHDHVIPPAYRLLTLDPAIPQASACNEIRRRQEVIFKIFGMAAMQRPVNGGHALNMSFVFPQSWVSH